MVSCSKGAPNRAKGGSAGNIRVDLDRGDIIETQPSLFASLWRYKWRILVTALLAAAVGYGLSLTQATEYRAEGTVLLNDPRTSGGIASEIGLVSDSGRYVRNQAQIMESPQVAQRAAEILGNGTTAGDVEDALVASPAANLDAVIVQATMPTAQGAVDVVEATVVAYEEVITGQVQNASQAAIDTLVLSRTETEARIAELDAALAEDPTNSIIEAQRTAAINQLIAVDTRIEQIATNAALYGSGVQLFIPPDTPTTPIQPQPVRNAVIAAVFGLLAAGTWAWRRAQRDRVADDPNVIAALLNAPLLATVPEFSTSKTRGPAPTVTAPTSAASEAYQFAMSSLQFAMAKAGGHTVLITSPSPGDGKTATALNLAVAAAHEGQRVLLVDGDERARGLTSLAGFSEEGGITDLKGPGSISDVIHTWALVDGTKLDFVPGGRAVDGNTASYFRSPAFRSSIEFLYAGRDMVIVDSPPVLAAAETADLAASVDAVVLVVTYGSLLSAVEAARQRLSMSGTPIIGFMLNRWIERGGQNRYAYGYGYGNRPPAD